MSSDLQTPAPGFTLGGVGYVDHLSFELISGWAWDPALPDTPVSVELLDGERVLLRICCDLYRPDLRKLGAGDGRHGFVIHSPSRFLDGARHFIRIRRQSDGCILDGGAAWIERSLMALSQSGRDGTVQALLRQTVSADIASATRPEDLAACLAMLSEGMANVVNARVALAADKRAAAQRALRDVVEQAGWQDTLAALAGRMQREHPSLYVPVHEVPEVSVIVVATDDFASTYRCLASLVAQSPASVAMEVILVDDASSDETLLAGLLLTGGIRLIRNAEPLGLPASRNAGAARARGRLLVFLDRDTETCAGWLETLVASAAHGIGLVGSMSLDSAGQVWQCGAILWRLGDIWPWGRGSPAGTQGLRHLRDTDLLADGATLIEAGLFARIGGFSDEFPAGPMAAADLAFRVRAEGLRVVVQPASQLVWRGPEAVVPARQLQILLKRWETPLSVHRFTGQMPALEAARSVLRRALYVTTTLPVLAPDGGLPSHLQALLELGFAVSLWSQVEASPLERHTAALLERHGVQCLGSFCTLAEAVESMSARPELIYLHGLRLADQAAEVRLRLPRARIICQVEPSTVRTDATTDDLQALGWVDGVLVASDKQAQTLRDAMPALLVWVAPTPLLRQKPRRSFALRTGFACLSDFSDPRDVAAVHHLAEAVMPRLRSRLAARQHHAECYLIGPNMPAELAGLQEADLHVIGFVPVLADMLHRLRCTLLPPGGAVGEAAQRMVLDSFAHGLPCVIGHCMAEALALPETLRFLVADGDDAIAATLVALHEDAGLNASLAEAGLEFLAERHGASLLRVTLAQAVRHAPRIQLGFADDGESAREGEAERITDQPGCLEHEIEYCGPGHIRGWVVDILNPQRRVRLMARFAGSGRSQSLVADEMRPYRPRGQQHCGFTLRWNPFADGFAVAITSEGSGLGDIAGQATQAAAVMAALPPRRVTVVVPVYGGLEETLCCLRSVHAARGETAHRVLIIDDCSPDPQLSQAVASFAAEMGFAYRRLTVNRGFVGCVNLGMASCPDDDVVLLNADTEVADFWLDRLHQAAQRHPRIASVTPMSNNASIMSIPMLPGATAMPGGRSLAEMDALCSAFDDGVLHDVPTAHGFCMYISRDALDDVGLFDAELFGRGYGEENDFSLRARDRGWRNVVTANVFVRHVGSVSFSTSQAALLERNLALLNQRHTGYDQEVAAYIAIDPLRRLRARVQLAMWCEDARRAGRPVVVMVALALPGGTMRHVEQLSDAMAQDGTPVLWVRSDSIHAVTLGDPAGLAVLRYAGPRAEAELLADLLTLRPGLVHVHHVLDLAGSVPALLMRSGLPMVITAHDYFFGCPRVTLLEASGRFCEAPAAEHCAPCLTGAPHEAMHPSLRELAASGETWRGHWAAFLAHAAQVIVPSRAAALYMARMFPEVHFSVRPHPQAVPPASRVRAADEPGYLVGDPNRIAVIGAIGPHKGSALLHELVSHCHRHEPDLRFIIVGHTDRDAVLERYSNVEITGKYESAEALDRIADAGCVAALFLSPWPETYCFTLSEALLAGLTPVALDRGAVGERLHDLGQGVVLAENCGVAGIVEGLRIAGRTPLQPILPPLSIDGHYPDLFADYYAALPKASAPPLLLGPRQGVMADLWCEIRIELALYAGLRPGLRPTHVMLRMWNHDIHPSRLLTAWLEGAPATAMTLPCGTIGEVALAVPQGGDELLWLRCEFDDVSPLGGGDPRWAASTLHGVALVYADGVRLESKALPAADGDVISLTPPDPVPAAAVPVAADSPSTALPASGFATPEQVLPQ